MKLAVYVIIFVLNINIVYAATSFGSGELKISRNVLNSFISYIKAPTGKSPSAFYITTDGLDSIYWYCPHCSCMMHDTSSAIRYCSQRYNKDCKKFARKRTIKWNNGINKNSKILSKWSNSEIEQKLVLLGFMGETKLNSKKKMDNSKDNNNLINKDVVDQLKDLKELFDSDIITKEEFDNLKKKILN